MNIFESLRLFFFSGGAVVYAVVVNKMFRRISVNLFKKPSSEINIRK